MFKESRRNNPMVAPKTIAEKRKTFIAYKNLRPGLQQENHVVFKNKIKNDGVYNYMYIGCPYEIGLAKNENGKGVKLTNVVLLQDENQQLYVVPIAAGRNFHLTNTWCAAEIRTLLHYIPALTAQIDINVENEYLYDIDISELIEFKAIGVGINTKPFKGYPITYKNTLIKNNVNNNPEIIAEKEKNDNFANTELDDLLK